MQTHLFPHNSQAHRLILAMNSAVLEEKLFDQNETASNSHLILADDSPEAFYAVLEYMYGGCPNLVSVPLALKVSDLAVKYQMEDLHSACSLVSTWDDFVFLLY